ncbi:hypothetical protein KUCAC02_014886 [Chaenocephalus aceratus]|uniref:Uncharacterized protein n=1 Tax=Chaenocephalus aceratus TaxID=36190 RepID=A0ACB9WH16_CHAAC|nr:hypothetical protein KUCAC02_014886 [Chaenocephalus aceratus]
MWSLGCIIAEMYFGSCLFPGSSKYCIMKVICHMIGQPGDHLLNAGKFTSNYFIRELKNSPEWRFKTLEEYKKEPEKLTERATQFKSREVQRHTTSPHRIPTMVLQPPSHLLIRAMSTKRAQDYQRG